jgi:hypothetical protein
LISEKNSYGLQKKEKDLSQNKSLLDCHQDNFHVQVGFVPNHVSASEETKKIL